MQKRKERKDVGLSFLFRSQVCVLMSGFSIFFRSFFCVCMNDTETRHKAAEGQGKGNNAKKKQQAIHFYSKDIHVAFSPIFIISFAILLFPVSRIVCKMQH